MDMKQLERFRAKEQCPCVNKSVGSPQTKLNATITHMQNNRKDEARVEVESDRYKERARVATTSA